MIGCGPPCKCKTDLRRQKRTKQSPERGATLRNVMKIEQMTAILEALLGSSAKEGVAEAVLTLVSVPEMVNGQRINWSTRVMVERYNSAPWVALPFIRADLMSCTSVDQVGNFIKYIESISVVEGGPIIGFTAGLLTLSCFKKEWRCSNALEVLADSTSRLLFKGNRIQASQVFAKWDCCTMREVRAILSSVAVEITGDLQDGRIFFASRVMQHVNRNFKAIDINGNLMFHALVRELGPKIFNTCIPTHRAFLLLVELLKDRT